MKKRILLVLFAFVIVMNACKEEEELLTPSTPNLEDPGNPTEYKPITLIVDIPVDIMDVDAERDTILHHNRYIYIEKGVEKALPSGVTLTTIGNGTYKLSSESVPTENIYISFDRLDSINAISGYININENVDGNHLRVEVNQKANVSDYRAINYIDLTYKGGKYANVGSVDHGDSLYLKKVNLNLLEAPKYEYGRSYNPFIYIKTDTLNMKKSLFEFGYGYNPFTGEQYDESGYYVLKYVTGNKDNCKPFDFRDADHWIHNDYYYQAPVIIDPEMQGLATEVNN